MVSLPLDKCDVAALVTNLTSIILTLQAAMVNVTSQLDQMKSSLGPLHQSNDCGEENPEYLAQQHGGTIVSSSSGTSLRSEFFYDFKGKGKELLGDEKVHRTSQAIPHGPSQPRRACKSASGPKVGDTGLAKESSVAAHATIEMTPRPVADSEKQQPPCKQTGFVKVDPQDIKSVTPTWDTEVIKGFDALAKLLKEYSTIPEDGWPKLWTRLRAMDKAKIDDYRDDIDTLLVFAGLFSAIVTAFVIAFYASLQPSSADVTAFILFQISTQLANAFPVNGTFLDTSQLSIPTFPFQVPQSAVRITILWFTSLIFALTSASFGILVKQWLREFMAVDDGPHDERCRIRYFRDHHMRRWRVYDIASFLPLLLQAAVVIFLAGLRDFAAAIHSTLGWVTTAFITVYLAMFVFTLLAPIFWVHSPFKTPFLKTLLQFPRYLCLRAWYYLERHQDSTFDQSRFWTTCRLSTLSRILNIRGGNWRHCRFTPVHKYWNNGFSAFEKVPREDRRYDIPLIVFSDAVFRDSNLENMYQTCLQKLDWTEFHESTLFPPSHTTTTAISTPDDFKRFWRELSSSCQRPIAEWICAKSEEFRTVQNFSSYFDAISWQLLFGHSDELHPYDEVVKDSRLHRLARNSPFSAKYVLNYFLISGRRSRIDLKSVDMTWASDIQCVQNLLHVYETDIISNTASYGVNALIILSRAILQVQGFDRNIIQSKFSGCLSKFVSKWSDLPSHRRREFGTLNLTPVLDHLALVHLELPGFVPEIIFHFLREQEKRFASNADSVLRQLLESSKQNLADLRSVDVDWASDPLYVRDLLEAYQLNMDFYLRHYGASPLVVLHRILLQLPGDSQRDVQAQFSSCVTDLVSKWKNPDPAWREVYESLDLTPFLDYLDSVEPDLQNLVPERARWLLQEHEEQLAKRSPGDADRVLRRLMRLFGQKLINLRSVDITWASNFQCVCTLLDAYQLKKDFYLRRYGASPLILLHRFVSQLEESDRIDAQARFLDYLSDLVTELKYPDPAWRGIYKLLDFTPFLDYLDSVDSELHVFVPQHLLVFLREQRSPHHGKAVRLG